MAGVPERLKLLVVEDDPKISQLLREVLALHGHSVAEVQDGALAADAVRAGSPDVVLLDIGLPNRHGLEVLDELKRDPETAGIPVVVVTAWWSDELERRARGAGAAAVVAKPFDIAEVQAAVAAAHAGEAAPLANH